MSNEFDVTIFIPKFVDENRDRIQKLNQTILAFEKRPSYLELLKEIMREVHTIKGTARIMGFGDIITLSHKVEDIFVKIKDGGLQPTKKLYDVVFRALDMLANMVEVKLKNAKEPVNVEVVCSQIDAVLSASGLQGTETELSQLEVDKIMADMAKPQGLETESSSFPFLPKEEARGMAIPSGHKLPKENEGEFKKDRDEVKVIQEGKKTIRIGLDKVDILYNHLVELIMAQMSFHQRYGDVVKLNHYAKQLRVVKDGINSNVGAQESGNKKLGEVFTKCDTIEEHLLRGVARYAELYEADVVKLDAITEGIRQQVMFMRMQPISAIFDLASRLVRDLSRQFNKEVDLLISGAEVELDNNITEMLKDPLVHLLRNAVDHGMEEPATRVFLGKKKTGTITLSAKPEGGDILITVEDDGKGIDKELIKETAIRKGLLSGDKAKDLSDEEVYGFIMKPGFSTSKIITDTSGRGVGMDVVKTIVDRLNGNLIIESNKGWGTRFVLKVPATITLVNVLFIRVGNMTLAIPSVNIDQITLISWKDVKTLEGKSSVSMKGRTIPLVHMADIFMVEKEAGKNGEGVPVILSRSYGKKVGFVVSEFLYEKEVVFREFKGYLKRPGYFSGVTTLGTGEVVLILNMQELIKSKDLTQASPAGEVSKTGKPHAKKRAILIAEDSIITAEMEKNILTNAGYEVDIATDGIDAMNKLPMKKYELLITDVDMPRMNGFELTTRVRTDKRLKDMPVIVVTARETVEDKRRGIEVGADAYILKKEFDQSNLLNTIKRLIGE